MKIVDKKAVETIYTLELTEREINTLVAGMGRTNVHSRAELAGSYGAKVLNMDESRLFYNNLKETFFE